MVLNLGYIDHVYAKLCYSLGRRFLQKKLCLCSPLVIYMYFDVFEFFQFGLIFQGSS